MTASRTPGSTPAFVRRVRRLAGPLALLLALATCSDSTAPGGGGSGLLTVRPVFPAGTNLAAFNLAITQVRLVLVRPPADTVVDTLVAFPLDQNQLQLEVRVPVAGRSETFALALQLRSGGTLLFSGDAEIEIAQGRTTVDPEDVPVTFVGPGSNIASLQILPRDTFLSVSTSFPFQLEAFDDEGEPVPDFYVSWSTTTGVIVNAAGVLTAPATPGSTFLRAATPTGVRDSTRVWFVPTPTSLVILSGDGQTGVLGSLLPTPLTVQVNGPGGVGIGGVTVRFRALVGGGSVADSVVVTDTLGIAATAATLGGVVGAQSFEASVTGIAPAVINATATVGTAASIAANSATTQATQVLTAVEAPPSVIVRDALGNPVPGANVTFAVIAGGGVTLPASPATVTTNAAGIATLTSWTIGTVAGAAQTLTATLAGVSGSPVTFTSSALAGPAAKVLIVIQPSAAGAVGVVLPQQPVARLTDAQDNPVSLASVTITASFASSPGGTPSLLNPTAVTTPAGEATFSGLALIGLIGNYTLSFTAPGLTPATSNAIALGVGAASATQSTVTATPATILADSAESAVVTVTARDAGGNPVAGLATVIAVSGSGNFIIQPAAVTDAAGSATGSFVSVVPGPKTVSATVGTTPITQTAAVFASAGPRILFAGDSAGASPPLGVFDVNRNGTGRFNITPAGSANNSNPRYSPDRTRVIFGGVLAASFDRAIFMASVDGLAVATVVSDTAVFRPRYNPTGTFIAFEVGQPFTNDQDVAVVAVSAAVSSMNGIGNGAGKRFVTDDVSPTLNGSSAFDWDPLNPNRLVVSRDTVIGFTLVSRLFGVNVDGGGVAPIGPLLTLGLDTLHVMEIAWSPNGAFLVLAAEVDFQRRLYRIDRAGNGLAAITAPVPGLEDHHPSISPDNTQVLFLRNRLDFEGNDWNYFVVPVIGTEANVEQVSNELASFHSSSELTCDWSPDGVEFVLVGTSGSEVGVYVMPVSTRAATYGANRRKVSGGTERFDSQPSWRP